MQDAEECIRLEPTFIKGYSRKGHLEFFMKDYEKALETYEVGFTHAPLPVLISCSTLATVAPALDAHILPIRAPQIPPSCFCKSLATEAVVDQSKLGPGCRRG